MNLSEANECCSEMTLTFQIGQLKLYDKPLDLYKINVVIYACLFMSNYFIIYSVYLDRK